MASTEDAVRAQLVTTTQSIATSDLGFDDTSGIHNYLLEFHPQETMHEYLYNDINGSRVLRAVGIQVLGEEEMFIDLNGGADRLYTITFELYYDLNLDVSGVRGDGAGVNAVVAAARKIREAINTLGSNLNATSEVTTNPSRLVLAAVEAPEAVEADQMVVGSFSMESRKFSTVDW